MRDFSQAEELEKFADDVLVSTLPPGLVKTLEDGLAAGMTVEQLHRAVHTTCVRAGHPSSLLELAISRWVARRQSDAQKITSQPPKSATVADSPKK